MIKNILISFFCIIIITGTITGSFLFLYFAIPSRKAASTIQLPTSVEDNLEIEAEDTEEDEGTSTTYVADVYQSLTLRESPSSNAKEIVGLPPMTHMEIIEYVSGTNYAYLALGTTVTANPVSNYCVLKVYQDLQSNVKVESISEINILDIETREDVDDNILGGWTIRDSGKAGSLGSEEAQSSFEKAMSEVIGVGYNPIQLLASQLVNGTNYIALARGRVAGADDTPELYVIRWYADLQGNSTVNEIKKFDLNYYVD